MKHRPGHEPDNNRCRRDSRERTRRLVDIQHVRKSRQFVRKDRNDSKRKATDTRGQAPLRRRGRWASVSQRHCSSPSFAITFLTQRISLIVDPPSTGACLFNSAPKNPAISGTRERHKNKNQHRRAQWRIIAEAPSVMQKDRRGHRDRDGCKPGDVLFPLHADRMPADGVRDLT